jgi:hypothetical protein
MGRIWKAVRSLGGKIAGGAKTGVMWTLSNAPFVSAVLVGAGHLVPGAAPVMSAIAGILSQTTGGAADPQLVEAIGQTAGHLFLLIGGIRKTIARAKPLLAPATPGK